MLVFGKKGSLAAFFIFIVFVVCCQQALYDNEFKQLQN